MINFTLDAIGADLLRNHYRGEHKDAKRILAGLAAPDIETEAYETLFRKSRALVALRNPALAELGLDLIPGLQTYRHLPLLNTMIVQEPDTFILDFADDRIRIERNEFLIELDPFKDVQVLQDIALAWAVCWKSNSNTVTIAHNGGILANAAGGQDRVGVAEAAGSRLSERQRNLPGLVAASDSFFPLPDGLLALKKYGVRVVFATQGGEHEREVAAFARENDMALMWLPDKIARGFDGH